MLALLEMNGTNPDDEQARSNLNHIRNDRRRDPAKGSVNDFQNCGTLQVSQILTGLGEENTVVLGLIEEVRTTQIKQQIRPRDRRNRIIKNQITLDDGWFFLLGLGDGGRRRSSGGGGLFVGFGGLFLGTNFGFSNNRNFLDSYSSLCFSC